MLSDFLAWFLALSILLLSPALMAYSLEFQDSEVQRVWLTLKLRDEEGMLVPYADVRIDRLTSEGPVTVARGVADKYGMFRVMLVLPRQLVGRAYDPSSGMVREVFASLNLRVIAFKGELFSKHYFPVDPTTLSHPLDSISKTIVLRRITPSKGIGLTSCNLPSPVPYQQITWQYTEVLRFYIVSYIKAKYDYPIGAKIRVQVKYRFWSSYYNLCPSSWMNGGYTEITLDRSLSSSYFSGMKRVKLKFEFKYIFDRYISGGPGIDLEEDVYAVDTSNDPRGVRRKVSLWDGRGVTGTNYYDTPPGDSTGIPVTGGYFYTFRVGVSFGYPVGVSVNLGVDKKPTPQATLKIVNTHPTRTARTYDGNRNYLISYTTLL